MLISIITLIIFLITLYLSASTIYLLVLAISYFIIKDKDNPVCSFNFNRFIILVPAHNEELLISTICQSLLNINYSKQLYDIFVIADNCSDNTVDMCKLYPVNVMSRYDINNMGKGYAIDYGLRNIPLDLYDAVLIIDADNFVDDNILIELNKLLNQGEQAIQCYNAVGNRDESWFTQILFVARTINNLLYHHSKYKLGLSSYLMGNGICFTTQLIKRKGWTAFTIGEDWEYYAQLLDDRIRIAFALNAKVFHQESKTLNQATSQRLRWSSGRFYVAKRLGLHLLLKGIRRKDWVLIDSSLPLLLPNYSLMLNLSLISLLAAFLVVSPPYRNYMLWTQSIVLSGQFILLLLGIMLSGEIIKILKALLLVPFFLLWKLIIDIITFTGIYRGKKWIRTKRHISKSG
jgi:cellulose synthase/poly-beta-1,6-N-acetylglucosamine synthase-like glycosyltransferase